MPRFFVSCPVHFEKKLIEEIEGFWFLMMDLDGRPQKNQLPEFEIVIGGIEFETELHLGLQLNFWSKIGYRVLLRQWKFNARYYDQLEKELKKINWEKEFDFQKTSSVSLQVDCAKSRLNNIKNITEVFEKSLPKGLKLEPTSNQMIYLRIVKDTVEISFDTSGEHLHFRGYRKHQGEAPLRENLAALLLSYLPVKDYQPLNLVDPFVGSGTLLFEAALKNYPQLHREYSFFNFKKCPALFKSESWKKNLKWIEPRKGLALFGIDKNEEVFEKLKLNQQAFKELFFETQIHCLHQSSLDIKASQISTDPMASLWIVANPPYGERLQLDKDIFQIFNHLESELKPSGMIILHPQNWNFQFKNLKHQQKIPFSNQGLQLILSIFRPLP